MIEIRKKESVSLYLSIRLLGEDALTRAFWDVSQSVSWFLIPQDPSLVRKGHMYQQPFEPEERVEFIEFEGYWQ